MAGNVSRSTDTRRPAGMRSMTDGSSTYVPALMRSLAASPRGGFSMKADTRPLGIGEDDAVAGRIVDPVQRDGALGVAGVVEGDEGA